MTTSSTPNPLEVLARSLGDSQLTDGDCSLLIVLHKHHRAYHVKGIRIQALAEELGVTPRTVSTRIASLASAGYIKQFSLGNRLPAAYYLTCFAQTLNSQQPTASDRKISSSPNIETYREQKDLPLREGLSALEVTTLIEEEEEYCSPDPEAITGLLEAQHSRSVEELVALIGHRQLGMGVSELVYFQGDEAISKEVLLSRRFLINIEGAPLRDSSFGKQVQSLLNAKHLHTPEALHELKQDCLSRLARSTSDSESHRIAEIEIELIDELSAQVKGSDLDGRD